jgi:hypothetical protein
MPADGRSKNAWLNEFSGQKAKGMSQSARVVIRHLQIASAILEKDDF